MNAYKSICPRYKSIVNWDYGTTHIHQVFHPAIWSVRPPGHVGVQFFGELLLLGNRHAFDCAHPCK